MTRRRIGFGKARSVALVLGLFACGGSPTTGAEVPGAAEPQAAGSLPASDGATAGAAELPAGYVEMRAAGILLFDGGHTVGLVSDDEEVMLPISIGGTEALSISLRLEDESFTRPLTHDLLDAILRELGAEVAHVQIDRMEQGVFYASVHLRHGGTVSEIDARSSDAVALAIGNDAPIFVARRVVEAAGITRGEDGGAPADPDHDPSDEGPGEDPREGPSEDDEQDDGDDEGRDGDTIDARAIPPPL